MKKVLVIIMIFIVSAIVLIVGGVVALLGIAGNRAENYWKYSEPNGEIEKKYTALGSYDVSCTEFNADDALWQKYEIWYPTEMKDTDTAYPLVVMANGTGTKASQYKAVFKHLASWGFIVAGNEDENCRTGESSAATLDFVLGLNEDKDSVFYGKVDIGKIGIAGHSQGGVGAINAVLEQENGEKYSAICAISATSRYHADELNKNGLGGIDNTSDTGWSVDVSKINIPIMMVAGTGLFDAGNMSEYSETLPEGKAQGICPLWWLNECYDTIPRDADKIIARQTGKDHSDMLRSADGYMTAWFMYYLKGDSEAGKAFWGEDAEILTNENWQDVRINP